MSRADESASRLTGDRLLRWLLVALAGVTVLGMASSLAELAGSNGAGLRVVRGWVSVAWFVLAVAVAGRSVVHIRRLRRLVTTREDQMAAVTATSRDWLWEATLTQEPAPELTFTSCSPSIAGLLGLRPQEVVGRAVLDFVSGEDRSLAQATIAAAARDGAGWDDVELGWSHADGHGVRMVGAAVPVMDRHGTVVGFRGARRLAPSDTDLRRRLAGIEHRVSEVIDADGVAVALQPIVSLQTGEWVGVEALARFPDGRAPDVWFAEAHEAGLGVDLELAAVRAALGVFDRLPERVDLSVNASPQLILDRRFVGLVSAPGVRTERVTVEMTEHAVVSRYEDVHQALAPLRERGLRLAVDDTGAGYASFSHVLRLRPDTIKLDRSLIGGIDAEPARRAFVTAIVLLALELNADVTAEGVETPAEFLSLMNLGVDLAQGYFLARPSTDAEQWVAWRTRTWGVRPPTSTPVKSN